jgi:hypothetical protein
MEKRPTAWEYLDAFPPPYCRCLAKEPGSGVGDMAVTDADLAIRSGIPIDRVREISRMTNWEGVPLAEMRAFFRGMNFDPTNAECRKRIAQYQRVCQIRKSTPFLYLRKSPKWETELLPLLLLALKIMKSPNVLLPATQEAVSQARS